LRLQNALFYEFDPAFVRAFLSFNLLAPGFLVVAKAGISFFLFFCLYIAEQLIRLLSKFVNQKWFIIINNNHHNQGSKRIVRSYANHVIPLAGNIRSNAGVNPLKKAVGPSFFKIF